MPRGRPPKNRQLLPGEPVLKPTVVVKFPPDQWEQVLNYHKSLVGMGLEGTTSDTVKELVAIGLSVSPTDAASFAARARAFNSTRAWFLRQVWTFLKMQEADLKKMAPHLTEEKT